MFKSEVLLRRGRRDGASLLWKVLLWALLISSAGCRHCHTPSPGKGKLLGISTCCPNEFVQVEPNSAVLTVLSSIGNSGFGFPVGSTAVDSAADRFYVVRNNGATPHLLAVDTNSGAFVESPALTDNLMTIGYDSDAGKIVAVTSCCPNRFGHLDAATGVFSTLSSIGDATFGFAAGATALDPSTQRFFMVRSSAGTPHLITVDTLNGALTQTPALSKGLMKLAFDEDDSVLVGVTACCPNELVHVDTSSGALTSISNVGDSGFGFSAGASAIDSASNRLFLIRSHSGNSHVLSVDTMNGTLSESPALVKSLFSLGFDAP